MYDASIEQQDVQISEESGDSREESLLKRIDSLVAAFPGDGQKPPDSALGSALNNMMLQWNSLLSQVVTEVDYPQPILEHIKETAEFSVKQFRDACLEMNSELTRISMDWQLKYPEKMTKQEVSEYEKSIKRQEKLLAKLNRRLDEEVTQAEGMNFIDTI